MKNNYLIVFVAALLINCAGSSTTSGTGPCSGSGGGDAGADAGPCLPCSAMLAAQPSVADIARLCPASVPLWTALHDDCACDLEPMPPPGKGQCAGPCTYHPTAAGSWCDNFYQEPTCLACLASAPVGCHGERYACLNDVGSDQ